MKSPFPSASPTVVVAIVALLFTVGAQIPYWSRPTVYRSDARFLISPAWEALDSSRLRSQSLEALEDHSIVATLAAILEDASHLPEADQALRDAAGVTMRAGQLGDANVVELVVEGPDPAITGEVARAAAAAATRHFLARHQTHGIDVLRPARVGQRVGPSRVRAGVVGLGVGLLAGLVVLSLWPRRATGEPQPRAAGSAAARDLD